MDYNDIHITMSLNDWIKINLVILMSPLFLLDEFSKTMWDLEYISEEGRQNLKNYKYKGDDQSVISKFLDPYWEMCVQQLPTWLA